MQEGNKEVFKTAGQISNSKVADSGGKMIFENPTLCSQLLRDYSGLEMLKDVKADDIEDVTERFIPMFTEDREADVVKKVHLSDKDVFVALIEHKSGVDYNVGMQILRYMVYIWEDYEKQMEASHKGISCTKDFKYPPILPIVYYEDSPKWTADETLAPRIALNEAFADYIPDFKYHLISISDFAKDELIERGDGLSLVMLLNRIRNADEFKALDLPKEYLSSLILESPKDVLYVIARVIAVILRKQNVPEDDIQSLVEQLEEKKSMALFDNYVGFDVQEERRIASEKAIIKKVYGMFKKGYDLNSISEALDEPSEYVKDVCEIASKPEINCDVDKIFDELEKKRLIVPAENA